MINTSSTLETISSGRVFVKRTRAQSKLLHTWIISVTCAPRVPHCLPRSSATPAFGLRVSSCGFRGFEVSRFRGFEVSRLRGFEVSGFGFRECPTVCFILLRCYMERELNENLCGNEVYYTACSLLVILKKSCSKFRCQRDFD